MKTKMKSLLKTIKEFWKNADAQDLVEYALLLMMIAFASVASIRSVAAAIKTAFTNANVAMVELNLPGNATGTVAASLAATAAVDNAAANANAADAAAAGQAAAAAAAQAAADLAAATADIGNITTTTFGRGHTVTTTGPASTADIAAAVANGSADSQAVAAYDAYTAANATTATSTAVAIDDASASADDAAAAIAASLGVDTATIFGVGIGADQLTADANAETAAATSKTATGSFLGF
jgi:SWI/SNF-related matrix-associated actin-dependent regulator 1 of chromatin subfamily A